MAEIKRLNYFTSQFLVEGDFKDEQAYHRQMLQRHNRGLHEWGIVDGLEVSQSGDKEVTVNVGTAVDGDGRFVVLTNDTTNTVNLSSFGNDTTVFITIAFQEVEDPADQYSSGAVDDFTRTTERPLLEGQTGVPPTDGSVIPLAAVQLDGSGNISGGIDNTVRKLASAKILPQTIGNTELVDGAVSFRKLNTALQTDTTVTLSPGGTEDITAISIPLSEVSKTFLLINAYSPDDGAGFEWKQTSTTEMIGPTLHVNQNVRLQNATANVIEVDIVIRAFVQN